MTAMYVPFGNSSDTEIGKVALARVDLEICLACRETTDNIFPPMQGVMIKVPGAEYVGRTYLDSAAILRS